MIYFETYGCPSNKADTEIMKALLGGMICEDIDRAEIVVVNSCGVKGQTERKVLKRIFQLCEKKKVIVSGCLPRITDKIDGRASLLGTNVSDIASVVEEVLKGNRVERIKDSHENKAAMQERFELVSTIPISEGCVGACTYCATRFARGLLRSFPKEDIEGTIKRAHASGAREFHLTAQDTGCWGQERGEDLADLLSAIEEVEGDFFVRVGMMNPNSIKDFSGKLTDAFMHPRIYKFLHLPLQSGSQGVLRDMGRNYTPKEVLCIIDAFRSKIENLYLCTDVIVGFPTETEEDFLETLRFIEKVRPDKINQTMYSPRPKTISAHMKQMPDRIKKDRSRMLYKLRMEISREINEGYVGKRLSCFINECGKGRPTGRIFNYKPVVADGHLGETKEVEIKACTPTYLIA